MLRTCHVLAALCVFTQTIQAAEPKDVLKFSASRFSIKPLESLPGTESAQPLIMSMAPIDGFSPNVNINIQPYDGTIADYVTLSEKQFETANLRLVKKTKQVKSVATFEYAGEIQGRKLHFYSRAESGKGKDGKGKVYLVTATATEDQWDAVANNLKSCVDSFRYEDGEPAKRP